MSLSVSLLLGNEFDQPGWERVFSDLLGISFEKEGELSVALHFGSEILLSEWSFGDEEDDYEGDLQGLEWVCFKLTIWKLHTRWHDLDVCVRQTFMLILEEELKNRFGLRTQAFYEVQLKIRRGYGGVLPGRRYRGRDRKKYTFGESIYLETDGISEHDLVTSIAAFLPVDLSAESGRTGSYVGMEISMREIFTERFELEFQRIPGIHIDDELTFRMGFALLLSDFIQRRHNEASFVVRMAGGYAFGPEEVPLCSDYKAPTDSLKKT